jgi:hypothetical protein
MNRQDRGASKREREKMVRRLDAMWRDHVRERDDWRCRKCGQKKARGALHAHHVAKRRLRSTRWEPGNGLSLCKECHLWAEEHPDAARAWACTQMGETLYDAVVTRARDICKFTTDDLIEMLRGFQRGEPISSIDRRQMCPSVRDGSAPGSLPEDEGRAPLETRIGSSALCTRRLETVDDNVCLNCFLSHQQLQDAYAQRGNCIGAHVTYPNQSIPPRSHPMTSVTNAAAPSLSTQEWELLVDVARTVARSGFLPPGLSTPEKAAAIILKGRELGIPAMQSIAHIHAIAGKLTCSAELMLALLARGGITWTWTKDGTDHEQATIQFHREGFQPVSGRFTMDDARRIETVAWEGGEKKSVKLADQDSWKNYPANLLRARAIANGARMIGPDLLTGISYTPEELGADVDEDGQPFPKQRPEPHVRFLRRCAALLQDLDEETSQGILREFDLKDPAEVAPEDTETMRSVVEALQEAAALSPAIAAG